MTALEVAVDTQDHLGESPVWDERIGALWWVDITGHRIHRWDSATGHRSRAVDADVGALVLRERGGVVIAQADSLLRLPDLDAEPEPLAALHRPGQRINDAHGDPTGHLWTGTLALDGAPGEASLYRVSPDGKASEQRTGISVSNGLGFSPDGTRFYHVDSPTHEVVVYPYDATAGSLGTGKVLFTLPAAEGVPDGLAVDADGCLWLAAFGGGRVLRITPGGRVDATVRLPITHPTSCAFGGDGLNELFITSAWRPLTTQQRREQPHAGAVFRIVADVCGLPARRFAG